LDSKRCGKCKEVLPVSSFSPKGAGRIGYQSYCRACKKFWDKEKYKTKRKYFYDKQVIRRERNRLWLEDYKKKLKCSKCELIGDTHWFCMTFHHRDPGKKEKDISSMIHEQHSFKTILKEIGKCDVLCHNCHAELHYYEREENRNNKK